MKPDSIPSSELATKPAEGPHCLGQYCAALIVLLTSPMPRHHHKSRRGCSQCKARRVKVYYLTSIFSRTLTNRVMLTLTVKI
jgi:hypothetical protein